MRLLPVILCVAALLQSAAAQNPIDRYLVTIEGLSEQPQTFTLSELGLNIEVIETQNGNDPQILKSPGAISPAPLSFFLPEIDDEVLVLFSWMQRIINSGHEPHHADIVGYDRHGAPVARWYLENAWPSKVHIPPLRAGDNTTLAERRSHFSIQFESLTRVSLDGLAPWPKILRLRTDRRNPNNPTFTFTWCSAPGATYSVRGWDPVKKEEIIKQAEVPANGPETSFTAPLLGTDIFFVVLTSPPPPAP